jgi:hypothetical protein
MAKTVIADIIAKRDAAVLNTEAKKREATTIHKRSSDYADRNQWLQEMSAPRERQGWSFEKELRLKNSLVRNTTNHLGRQRPSPNVSSVNMVAHTARGTVNLNDYRETMKDFVKLGTKCHDSHYDPRQHLVHTVGKVSKKVSSSDFSIWLENTKRWQEDITAKVREKEKAKTRNYVPQISKASAEMVQKSRDREAVQIEQEMLDHDGSILLSQFGSPSDEKEVEKGNPNKSLSPSLRNRRRSVMKMNMSRLDTPDMPDTDFNDGNAVGNSVVPFSPPSSLSASEINRKLNQDKDEQRKLHYKLIAEKVAKTPDVFVRMASRIEAFSKRAVAERELNEVVMNDLRFNSEERQRLFALRERRRRSQSPTLARASRSDQDANVNNFTPKMNPNSKSIVMDMEKKGARTPIMKRQRAHSAPMRRDTPSTPVPSSAQERVMNFLDSVGNQKKDQQGSKSSRHSNNQQEDKKEEQGRGRSPTRRKTFVFEKSLRSVESRPSSAPPDRPRWGIRSISSEAVLDRYDTIEMKYRRSLKKEQRVRDTHSRSKSPTKVGSKVALNTRRYTMAALPQHGNSFAADPDKFTKNRRHKSTKIDDITRKLSVLYERRKSAEMGGAAVSSSKSIDTDSLGDETTASRRSTLTENMNNKLISRSRFRGQTFEERTRDSVDDFIVRKGVADAMALHGMDPGPGSYNVSGDKKSYFSNCSVLIGGEAVDARNTAGKYGFDFGKRSVRRLSQYRPLEVKGVAYKLMEDGTFMRPSVHSSGDRLPDVLHEDTIGIQDPDNSVVAGSHAVKIIL